MKKILAALESGADRVKLIAAITGNTTAAVRTRLAELRRLGVVRSFRVRGGSRPDRSQREKRYMLTRPFAENRKPT